MSATIDELIQRAVEGDETFAESGGKQFDLGQRGQFRSIKVLSNGKLVAFGHGGPDFMSRELHIARFMSDGSFDLSDMRVALSHASTGLAVYGIHRGDSQGSWRRASTFQATTGLVPVVA